MDIDIQLWYGTIEEVRLVLIRLISPMWPNHSQPKWLALSETGAGAENCRNPFHNKRKRI